MPLPLLAEAVFKGLDSIPYAYPILKTIPWLVFLYLLKVFFGGARNKSERMMHSKVIMITGGTSGIGASLAHSLAVRGAQIILLVPHPASDPFVVDFIEDMRSSTNNTLIYAEHVDLSSLHSIRLFATKWVDNAPPRRLDMLILAATTMTPPFTKTPVRTKADALELNWQVNYLANFHLLSILSPALRAQPPDRDVRVLVATCASYIGASLDLTDPTYETAARKRQYTSSAAYGASKLALMVFAHAFQKHLDAYARPDKQPNNARVVLVDPGWAVRTPGMRRWLSCGSLWGLALYLLCWPAWWLVLKSPEQGAQSFLRAAMEADLGRGAGARLVKECREVDFARRDVRDEKLAGELWGSSERLIERVEKEGALRRTREKKEREARAEAEKKGPEKVPGSRRSRKAG